MILKKFRKTLRKIAKLKKKEKIVEKTRKIPDLKNT